MSASSHLNLLPESNCGTGAVPVFNCVVILRRSPETGRLAGRVANLAGITAEGSHERELLIVLTKQFKARVQEAVREGRTLAWLDPPEQPADGEQQRFIPVHL